MYTPGPPVRDKYWVPLIFKSIENSANELFQVPVLRA